MIFSSTVFLFQFPALCLAVYFAVLWISRKIQYANVALLVASVVFYFIGRRDAYDFAHTVIIPQIGTAVVRPVHR